MDFLEKVASVEKETNGRQKTVHTYLKKNYPADTLEWVKETTWVRKKVPLNSIQMARRPGGAREQDKVKGIAQAFRNGKPMEPVVIVELPDGTRKIADGYHRTLGCKHADKKEIDAWLGKTEESKGPWDKEMHEKKLNVGKKATLTELAASFEKEAFVTPLAKGIGNMAAKTVKGAGKEIKNYGKGITGMGTRKAKQNLVDVKLNPNSTKMDIKGAKKELRGERFNQTKSVGLTGLAAGGAALDYSAKHKNEMKSLTEPQDDAYEKLAVDFGGVFNKIKDTAGDLWGNLKQTFNSSPAPSPTPKKINTPSMPALQDNLTPQSNGLSKRPKGPEVKVSDFGVASPNNKASSLSSATSSSVPTAPSNPSVSTGASTAKKTTDMTGFRTPEIKAPKTPSFPKQPSLNDWRN